MKPFKWLLNNQLKQSSLKQKVSGFTLIELLVAMVIASLIITPLLGFMINILDNDRKEQAKANTEQEIKAALDYITRDLQQSVYIYDADGISAIRNELPKSSTDDKKNFFPVLVFWKRQYIPNGLVVKSTTITDEDDNTTTTVETDDTFVYSLVVYYLIKDNNTTWSNAARLGRFQINNGYGQTETQKNSTRDTGFQLFDLSNEGNLQTKMNNWKKKPSETYTKQILPLVDYIDQTTIDNSTNPAPTCSMGQLVPQFSGSGDAVATDNVRTRGFYVCVDSSSNVAEIYLRGNSLARLQNNNMDFNENKKTYFPQVGTRVQGLGFLFTN
ncbi:MAG: hormogonium polysaccharide secretion pseudopilin HpsC [Trichormus sp. ATA11-4-KO1]|jgi:prepilin-type N-terminal cleavage/methylation domain-containing protein|nr:hormogonium polysaccharide secretion pseudopilin HpsC [Trichormus sp. ATA11-4-KO1]